MDLIFFPPNIESKDCQIIHSQNNDIDGSNFLLASDEEPELELDRTTKHENGKEVWEARKGSLRINVVFNNQPSKQAKKEFNKAFNEILYDSD